MNNNGDKIEVKGIIIEQLVNGYKVKLEEYGDVVVNAKMSGKLKMRKMRLLVGDKVVVELSPYDMTQGRIIKRIIEQRFDNNSFNKKNKKKK